MRDDKCSHEASALLSPRTLLDEPNQPTSASKDIVYRGCSTLEYRNNHLKNLSPNDCQNPGQATFRRTRCRQAHIHGRRVAGRRWSWWQVVVVTRDFFSRGRLSSPIDDWWLWLGRESFSNVIRIVCRHSLVSRRSIADRRGGWSQVYFYSRTFFSRRRWWLGSTSLWNLSLILKLEHRRISGRGSWTASSTSLQCSCTRLSYDMRSQSRGQLARRTNVPGKCCSAPFHGTTTFMESIHGEKGTYL